MCGIAGFFGLRTDDPRALASSMCEAIRHRGPDGGGVTTHEGVALGMVRLAIVDVEHGQQPMLSDDGQIALVYNGEVYNAPALRRELEAEGVRFRTRSDTEVILRLYERDPSRVEELLVGMWAFAIHDRRRRRLTLSRDRFGIKPFFVVDSGEALAFGSELRVFRAVADQFPGVFSPDPAAAHAMLAWSYVPNEDTIYRGVRRLAPATRMEIDLDTGARRTRRYWRLEPAADAARVRTLDEACELTDPLLRRAVTEHLESDVPVAAFLSGGIDSSLVLLHAMAASPSPIRAFTIGFRERRFDESPFAREVAGALGAPLHVELLDEEAARLAVPKALAAYDEPFGDSSSLATYLLSEVVARSHKVALGGDGGDEVFAGYKKHRIVGVRELVGGAPKLRDLAARALMALPSRTDRTTRIGELLRTAKRVARGLHGSDAEAYVALTQVGSLEKTSPLAARPSADDRFVTPLLRAFEDAGGPQIRRHAACDMLNSLPNDMLVKVDRASMACHLEARVPLLDHRIAEAGAGLPSRFTLGRTGKVVLKELYARRFGRALAHRKKQGFGVPVEKWLRGHLAPECDRLFDARTLDRHGLLSSRELGGGRWRAWAQRDPQLLWHAFALASWCEQPPVG